MQSTLELVELEAAPRSGARRSSRGSALYHALRRIVRLDFFSLEDEIGRAIDRAFAEFAREMRK
jgi:hypothetical protein